MNCIENRRITTRDLSGFAERELQNLKKRRGNVPGGDAARREAEAKKLQLTFRIMADLTERMIHQTPEYACEGKAIKRILHQTLHEAKHTDGSYLAQIGRFQGALEVLSSVGGSLSAPGAISAAAGKVLEGKKFVFQPGAKGESRELERHKNLGLVKGGLDALAEVAGFQCNRPAQLLIESGPGQSVTLEYLKDFNPHLGLDREILARMAQKELQLLKKEPLQPKNETRGDKAFRLSEEAEAAITAVYKLAPLVKDHNPRSYIPLLAAQRIAEKALEFTGLQPDRRIGNFQGALEVISALGGEEAGKTEIAKAAGRVLKGDKLVINAGAKKPGSIAAELESWKSRELHNSGLASLAILTQTAGCRKAQKILDTQKGDYALLSLQELKNRKSGR